MNERSSDAREMETSFGFQNVEQGEKQPLVNEVFHNVASRYDLMNDLMSGGMHRIWKDAMVSSVAPPKSDNRAWHGLDVAGGTADIAFRILDRAGRASQATVFDINASMLEVGRQRAAKKSFVDRIDFVEGNAEELPFADASFDAYTIAFGIRNVPRMDKALAEAHRVLKRGGKFLCLEFSQVDMPLLDGLYKNWSERAIPAIGKMVTGDRESYQYLVESIAKFPNQSSFASAIEEAGFSKVSWQNFSGGIVALHSGWKL